MTLAHSEMLHLSFGPHNAPTLGPLRIKVLTQGETVITAVPDLGYLHRGIEKTAEKTSWTGFSPFLDRVDYLSPIHCTLAYALAVEALAGIETPARALRIRLLTGELNRIGSHLFTLGNLAFRIGATTAGMYMLRDREKFNNLFEMICGARLTYNYVRIGGVAFDLTEGFIEKTQEVLDYLEPKLREYETLLLENGIFVGRLKGVGFLTKEDAISANITGPNLRASGVQRDLRKNKPYCDYQDFLQHIGSNIPNVEICGDALSRFHVRVAEVKDSIAMIRDALDGIPKGKFRADVPLEIKPPAGEAYAEVESARGSFGVYVCSTGQRTPDRLKIRGPSSGVVTILPKLLSGVQISDVSTIVGSLDIMVSEVDR